MPPFLALIAAIGCITLALSVVYTVALLAFLPTVLREGGFVLDEKKYEEILHRYPLGWLILALHPLAFWWCNLPLVLWFRFVKKDKTVDLSHPKPRH